MTSYHLNATEINKNTLNYLAKFMKKTILLSTLIFTLAACSGTTKDVSYPKSPEDQAAERVGKLTGDEGLKIIGGSKKKGRSATEAINVNSYLWRASLDAVYFMPLISADPFGGVILTDWYMVSPNAKERFKFNIIIVGAELRPDAIKVSGFKQIKDSTGHWKDAAINSQLVSDIEDRILLKARELKVTHS